LCWQSASAVPASSSRALEQLSHIYVERQQQLVSDCLVRCWLCSKACRWSGCVGGSLLWLCTRATSRSTPVDLLFVGVVQTRLAQASLQGAAAGSWQQSACCLDGCLACTVTVCRHQLLVGSSRDPSGPNAMCDSAGAFTQLRCRRVTSCRRALTCMS
jgi:hypothetical protein